MPRTGEGYTFRDYRLLPSEGWEKVANGRMRALLAHDRITNDYALVTVIGRKIGGPGSAQILELQIKVFNIELDGAVR